MARRMRAGRRRSRRRTVWFAPRTDPDHKDPSVSCWADVGLGFYPIGATGTPRLVWSPIVTNIAQAVTPTVDADLNQHPLSERWTVQRIVGDIAFQAYELPDQFGTTLRWDGVDVHWGIYRGETIGDAFPLPRPDENFSCLGDWLHFDHFSMSTAEVVCHDCDITYGSVTDAGNCATCPGTTSTGITGAQMFGVPNLVWRHVDVKVKRKILPEHGLWIVACATVGVGAEEFVELSWRPMCRVLLSSTT